LSSGCREAARHVSVGELVGDGFGDRIGELGLDAGSAELSALDRMVEGNPTSTSTARHRRAEQDVVGVLAYAALAFGARRSRRAAGGCAARSAASHCEAPRSTSSRISAYRVCPGRGGGVAAEGAAVDLDARGGEDVVS